MKENIFILNRAEVDFTFFGHSHGLTLFLFPVSISSTYGSKIKKNHL